jgi:hypothetical protein
LRPFGVLGDVKLDLVAFIERLEARRVNRRVVDEDIIPVSLADLGLQPDASDRAVWEAWQREQIILITANRTDAGPDSLEATIQQHNTPASLSVFTLANEQRVLRDRLYAAAVADRLLEFLFDIDRYRGTGRLYVP